MKKTIVFILLFSISLNLYFLILFKTWGSSRIEIKKGDLLLKDSVVTVQISELYLASVFGPIERYRPFRAKFENNTWEIRGSLPSPTFVGGVPRIILDAKDGSIINLWHDK